jgi:hypothetical protein
MPCWWGVFLLVSLAGDYLPFRWVMPSTTQMPRILPGIRSIAFPRNKYHEFDQWLDANVTARPALVLIEIDPNDTHIDYVTNMPGLDQPVLRARYIKGVTDLQKVIDAFPERNVYLCQPNRKTIQLLKGVEESSKKNGT